MNVVLITPPVLEPVDLASLKTQLNFDSGSFSESIDEIQLLPPAAHAVNTAYTLLYELMTLDVAPGGAGWAAGDTVTGGTSTKTCKIVEVLTTLTYTIRDRSGTFTLGEILTNGTATADQGLLFPTFAPTKAEVLGYNAIVTLESGLFTTGTADVKIQDSEDAITWADVTGGAFTQVSTAAVNDNAIQEKAYTGVKRYIRTAAKILVATCLISTRVTRSAASAAEDDLLTELITTARLDVENDTARQIMTATWDYFPKDWPAGDRIKIPWGNLQSVTSVKWKDTDGVETNLTKTLEAFALSSVTPLTKTKVTCTAHGFSDGDIVNIDGTTSYDGAWVASNVTTNTFDITMVFVADDATGTASEDYAVETNGDQCGFIVLPYGGSWPSGTLYPSNPITIRFVCGWTTAALVPKTILQAIKRRAVNLHNNRGDDVIGQTVSEDRTYSRLINNSPRLWDQDFL